MHEAPEQFNQKFKSYEMPEDIQRNELDVYDRLPDKEFWTEKQLSYWFAEDVAFGTKLWIGFAGILKGVLKRDTLEHRKFQSFFQMMASQSLTTLEKARATIQLREWVLKTLGISPDQLTARNILTQTYLCEAEVMRAKGVNPAAYPPFLLSSCLFAHQKNLDAGDIKKILQEEWERQQKNK